MKFESEKKNIKKLKMTVKFVLLNVKRLKLQIFKYKAKVD